GSPISAGPSTATSPPNLFRTTVDHEARKLTMQLTRVKADLIPPGFTVTDHGRPGASTLPALEFALESDTYDSYSSYLASAELTNSKGSSTITISIEHRTPGSLMEPCPAAPFQGDIDCTARVLP